MALDAGEGFQVSLQEVLSHQQFLRETLKPEVWEKLEHEASETLREAEAHRTSLRESKEVVSTHVSLLNSLKLMNHFVSLIQGAEGEQSRRWSGSCRADVSRGATTEKALK